MAPKFDNPYPDEPWDKVTAFDYRSDLHIHRRKKAVVMRSGGDALYVVSEPYQVRYRLDGSDWITIAVPKGMLTDFSSVPAIFRTLVSRVGRHLEASIVHDFLFIAWQDIEDRGAQKADFRFANALMGAAMKEASVHWFRRLLIRLAVGSFIGWAVYKARNPGNRYEP